MTIKNFIAPMCYAILKYSQIGLKAHSLNQNIDDIADDLLFA